MARKLKPYSGNYDGTREGLVFARNQREAANVAGCSLYHFREYWGECYPVDDSRFKPLTLYTRIPNYRRDGAEWFEGVCPHPKRKEGGHE